jgi:hypothetical protein
MAHVCNIHQGTHSFLHLSASVWYSHLLFHLLPLHSLRSPFLSLHHFSHCYLSSFDYSPTPSVYIYVMSTSFVRHLEIQHFMAKQRKCTQECPPATSNDDISSSSPKRSILDLPVEILLQIFLHVGYYPLELRWHPNDITALLATCKVGCSCRPIDFH